MSNTPKRPTAVKYTEYAFDADAKLIGEEDFYKRLDLATAAVYVTVRFPVRDNASAAKLLRDIAVRLEQTSCAMRREV